MSQATNYVKFCLDRAKKALQEGRKHTGLVEVTPDLDKAARHIRKAEHNFKAISAFAQIGFSDWSVSAAFYTTYHCFLAILAKYGYESRNQECTVSAIKYLKEQGKIELDDRFIEALRTHAEGEEHLAHTASDLRELREDFQYGVNVEYRIGIEQLQKTCAEMLEVAKDEVYRK
ncbi:HEPN domain-containing protein [Candidatus Woesearchaeota archaeon]|nr:HEPN domain-containing protein [Candidatus Woesearchaeota archaeon]